MTAASDTKETKFTKVENEIYDVVFAQPGSLGIVFNGDLSVSDVLKTSISRAHKYVKPGDTGGCEWESVENIELSDVAQLVKYNGKPRTLRFWRPGGLENGEKDVTPSFGAHIDVYSSVGYIASLTISRAAFGAKVS